MALNAKLNVTQHGGSSAALRVPKQSALDSIAGSVGSWLRGAASNSGIGTIAKTAKVANTTAPIKAYERWTGKDQRTNSLTQLGKVTLPSIAAAAKDAVKNSSVINGIKDSVSASLSGGSSGVSAAAAGSAGSSSASTVNPSAAAIDYLNADLAKHYGMDAATAYQEALSNTSYQRAVKDMQASGLNPAVLFSSGDGASGVSAAALPVQEPAEESSGSSGTATKSWLRFLPVVGAAVGAVVTKSSRGLYTGLTTGKAIYNALK